MRFSTVLFSWLVFLLNIVPTFSQTLFSQDEEVHKPNVVVIMTDEHNLRTIGRYREILQAYHNSSQSLVWGPDAVVGTYWLDKLSKEGATFQNFYTVSPVCTSSRGSFMTGTYPSTNGATKNHAPMNDDAMTFATVLKDYGYKTSYMGKWHLNGKTKGDQDFGAPPGRSFGFDDTMYQWNRGHWKFLKQNGQSKVKGFTWNRGRKKFAGKLEKHYTTDFLAVKAKWFIKEQAAYERPFALMVSLPDPHAPNRVRAPYDTFYDKVTFRLPETAKAAIRKTPAIPAWSTIQMSRKGTDLKNSTLQQAEENIKKLEDNYHFQKEQRRIFGMVRLIDDSVGKIVQSLIDGDIFDDTIVIFTSDHGDLMNEHGMDGKVLPYKASAGVPMIVRWPKKIKSGKIIETVYSSVDFTPTLLNLVGAEIPENMPIQGIDASADLLDDRSVVSNPSQTRFIDGPKSAYVVSQNGPPTSYAAAINQHYLFVLSRTGTPWLFDVKNDPDEMYNFYKANDDLTNVSLKLQDSLLSAMTEYDFGLTKQPEPVYLDQPACWETRNEITDVMKYTSCVDLNPNLCSIWTFSGACPVTCNVCNEDSVGHMALWKGTISCDVEVKAEPETYCQRKNVQGFCRKTCSRFL